LKRIEKATGTVVGAAGGRDAACAARFVLAHGVLAERDAAEVHATESGEHETRAVPTV
jgi:hypothetical protein